MSPVSIPSALAQQTVKIGVVAEFSGPFADYGAQIVGGMKAYLKQNGDVFGGKKIEIITRDTTGEMKRRGPKARVVEIGGVGHAPTLMHADQIAIVRDFLLEGAFP